MHGVCGCHENPAVWHQPLALLQHNSNEARYCVQAPFVALAQNIAMACHNIGFEYVGHYVAPAPALVEPYSAPKDNAPGILPITDKNMVNQNCWGPGPGGTGLSASACRRCRLRRCSTSSPSPTRRPSSIFRSQFRISGFSRQTASNLELSRMTPSRHRLAMYPGTGVPAGSRIATSRRRDRSLAHLAIWPSGAAYSGHA